MNRRDIFRLAGTLLLIIIALALLITALITVFTPDTGTPEAPEATTAAETTTEATTTEATTTVATTAEATTTVATTTEATTAEATTAEATTTEATTTEATTTEATTSEAATAASTSAAAASSLSFREDGELAGCAQVLLCTLSDEEATEGVFSLYQKISGRWNLVFSVAGRVGKKGIISEADRLQDSGKTPAGVMKIIGAFGIYDDPGAKFDYTLVTDSMYWNLDSESPDYNRLVTAKPDGEAEKLASFTRTYKYVLITDYNYEQAPGKGGAIFVHCNGAGATSGCVSIPESYMKKLVTLADPAKNPVLIVTTDAELQNYIN